MLNLAIGCVDASRSCRKLEAKLLAVLALFLITGKKKIGINDIFDDHSPIWSL